MSYVIPAKDESAFWPLPADYGTLTAGGKRKARLGLLQSWWSYDDPERLVTNPYNFAVAFRFFVDNYVKPAYCMNRPKKVFAKPDCRWVDHWIKMVSHPLVAMVAFRGASKTVHFVHLLPEFVTLCRPGTPVAVSEYNKDRTMDEIGTIMFHFEENELYNDEFPDQIKPKKYGRFKWSSSQLDLMNGSQVRGISINAAHRGRHPLLWVLDDIEKDKESDREEWREEFLAWFHGAGMGMMRPGSHVIWPGTYLNPNSCLMMVVQKLTPEFQNWKTIECPLIVRKVKCLRCSYDKLVDIDSDVTLECPDCGEAIIYGRESESFGPGAWSMWPEVYTVEEAELMVTSKGSEDGYIKAMTPSAFWTEMMNRPHLGGDRMFNRDTVDDGYRIYTKKKEQVVEVLKTKKVLPYEEWIKSIRVTAGVDVAYGRSQHSDYSAIVVLGFDPFGTCFVLDAWRGRVSQDARIEIAREMCVRWRVVLMAWECTGHSVELAYRAKYELQDVTNVIIMKHLAGEPKPMRISRMEIPMTRHTVLFPCFKEMDGVPSDGHQNGRHMNSLVQEVDRYTRSGKGTAHDDLLDGWEMAYYVNGEARPSEPARMTANEQIVKELKDAGIRITKHSLPMELWTDEMKLQARGFQAPKKATSGRPKIWT